jgi:hypothetical protein
MKYNKFNHLMVVSCLIGIGLIIFGSFRGCGMEPIKTDKSDSIRAVITKLKTITYHDTIYKIQTKYRRIVDSIQFNHYDSSWNILRQYTALCDTHEKGISDPELQSLVSRRLVRYCECNDLNRIYQNRRGTDSLIIANYTTLDSVSQLYLADCRRDLKNTVKSVKKEVKRKRIYKTIAATFLTLFIVK